MLRQRLPQLALEATSVVFAVLVALAVDEWREDRQNQELVQVTQATQFIPLERVQGLARLYNLQELFEVSQDAVMEFILGVGEVAETSPERIPRLLRPRLTNAVGMQDLLVAAYDSTLVAIGSEVR